MSEQDDVIHMVYRLKARGDGDYAALIRRIIAERDAARAACVAARKVWEAGCVDRGWKDERNWIDDVRDQLDAVVENGGPNAN